MNRVESGFKEMSPGANPGHMKERRNTHAISTSFSALASVEAEDLCFLPSAFVSSTSTLRGGPAVFKTATNMLVWSKYNSNEKFIKPLGT